RLPGSSGRRAVDGHGRDCRRRPGRLSRELTNGGARPAAPATRAGGTDGPRAGRGARACCRAARPRAGGASRGCGRTLLRGVVVPLAVLALVASIDLTSAGIMLLTLPLVPVFMWLVGRYAEHRARERWEALTIFAHHFADVVRGLPTLRAFNRAHAQAEQIDLVSDRYRTASTGTLH